MHVTFSRSHIFEWHKRFCEGRNPVKDNHRASCLSTTHTDPNMEHIQQILQEDHHIVPNAVVEDRCDG